MLALTVGARPRATRPARLPRSGPPGRDDRAARGRSRRAARRSNGRRPTRCAGCRIDDADGDDARGDDRVAARRSRASARTRCTTRRASTRALRAAYAGRPHRTRGRPPRTARRRRRTESLARQFDRVLGVLEAWGYLEGLGAQRRRASCSPGSNTEGDLVLAESLRDGLLDGTRRAPSSPRSCRASRTSGADPTATSRCRRAAGRAPLVARRGRARSNGSGATSTSPSATSGCPRPAGPIPGFTDGDPRVGDGRRSRRRARGRGDDRRRLRPQREADDRPAAPGRRRRTRPDDRGDRPRRRRRVPARASSPRRASSPCPHDAVTVPAASASDPEGRAVGPPGRGPPDLEVGAATTARWPRRARGAGRAHPVPARPRSDLAPRSGSRVGRCGRWRPASTPRRPAPSSRSTPSRSPTAPLAVNMVVLGTPPDRLRRSTRRVDARIRVDGRTWFGGRRARRS